jgi:hypothetical protein
MENLGLVGFTGAGSNRLFAALTGLAVPSEYEAAVGVASVPDDRLIRLAAMSKSKKVVAAGFELAHLALPPGVKPEKASAPSSSGRCGTATPFSSCCAFDDGTGAPIPRRLRRARARARARRSRERRAASHASNAPRR